MEAQGSIFRDTGDSKGAQVEGRHTVLTRPENRPQRTDNDIGKPGMSIYILQLCIINNN